MLIKPKMGRDSFHFSLITFRGLLTFLSFFLPPPIIIRDRKEHKQEKAVKKNLVNLKHAYGGGIKC